MKLLLLLVFVVFSIVNAYQLPDFDHLLPRHSYQVQHKSLPINDVFLYRQLLNSKNAADEGDEDDEDPFSSRYGFNSEEFNDINYNIQNDDESGDNEDDDSSAEISADVRQEETESHSSLVAGHQYVSGGAGEGKQHLQPDGSVPNKEEIKTDADLPAYCDPPNPCPFGYKGSDCDSSRHFSEYTADFSKAYQEQQFCMCDDDHNECQKTSSTSNRAKQQIDQINDLIQNIKSGSNIKKEKLSPVVAKKSPRIRRDLSKLRARLHPDMDRLARVAKKTA